MENEDVTKEYLRLCNFSMHVERVGDYPGDGQHQVIIWWLRSQHTFNSSRSSLNNRYTGVYYTLYYTLCSALPFSLPCYFTYRQIINIKVMLLYLLLDLLKTPHLKYTNCQLIISKPESPNVSSWHPSSFTLTKRSWNNKMMIPASI